ncbi:hypothetical protein BDV95DRAFT_122010 [Massariosphaeria phaeospora]|uniref:Uncharacterized protein n=1 Tax=Massariosphaeria phaeospora TaxID=100035 RepID=A0A7C8I227_9PLEO|nr:hypothetical protein BDV95DRAFT_122010 [Massariosphaeria phaeospora]
MHMPSMHACVPPSAKATCTHFAACIKTPNSPRYACPDIQPASTPTSVRASVRSP